MSSHLDDVTALAEKLPFRISSLNSFYLDSCLKRHCLSVQLFLYKDLEYFLWIVTLLIK